MGGLSQIEKDIIRFRVYCDCSTRPLRMKFTKIDQGFFTNKHGIFVCIKCNKRKRVEYISSDKYKVKDL